MSKEIAMWCTACGARQTGEETKNAHACPRCGNNGAPCHPDKDYLIEINWHELRILTIWATNFAASFKDETAAASQQALRGIIHRLSRQAPNETPLTIGGELKEIREAGYKVEDHNIPQDGLILVCGEGAVGHSKKPKV